MSRFQRRQSLAALALMLAVATPGAAAADPAQLIASLQRDFGALQAQLEQVDPGLGEDAPQTVGFNTDLGDGSPAFRRRSMVTIVHAAGRNLDRLVGAYRAAGAEPQAGDAEALRLSIYALTERIERLAEPAAAATIVVLRDQSRGLLGELVQDLDLLAAEPAAADPEAASGPQPRP